jgi:20S proteasome alpha/beta subunit
MRRVIENDNEVAQWSPTCTEEKSVAIVGDSVNAALFWVEKYYDKRLTVRQLIPLAAHLIVCAHQLNPAGIGGLEIVLCDSGGVNHLREDSIERLEQKGEEWDGTIRDLFLSYQQDYNYDPQETEA